MHIVYRASHTGSKAVVWTKQIQSCISLFGLLFYSSLLLVFPHNPFTLLSAVQLWESSGCTTLKMKIYHTCTAVVIKHSCLPSSEMKSKYFNNTAMKWLQRGSKWWHCPNAASLTVANLYISTDSAGETSSKSTERRWMVNDTAGSGSDSGFLSESWRGCEGDCTYVSNLVGCDWVRIITHD